MKYISKISTLMFVLFVSTQISAQSDLQIFGFFQTTLTKLDGKFTMIADVPPALFGTNKLTLQSRDDNYLTASVQQMNLFLRKELNENFTAWANVEVIGSYNSELKWGSFSLEEAWVNYQYNDLFNLKVGLLLPKFAYLNEIKNRMPLLPYITRPFVYEASISLFDKSDFVPERAFVQAYGYLPIGNVTLDYSAFVGQSEKTYIQGSGAAQGYTADTTNFKLFGGRIGLKVSDLRLGVSATIDKDNHQATLNEDVDRKRIALDLGYAFKGIFLDAEYFYVKLEPKNTTKDMDKYFYYGTIGYNFSDQLFAYGSYTYLKDNNDAIFTDGITAKIFGLGYKPTDAIVVKASYADYGADNSVELEIHPQLPPVNTKVDASYKMYQIAVSVLF